MCCVLLIVGLRPLSYVDRCSLFLVGRLMFLVVRCLIVVGRGLLLVVCCLLVCWIVDVLFC